MKSASIFAVVETVLAKRRSEARQRQLEKSIRKNGIISMLEMDYQGQQLGYSFDHLGEILREAYSEILREPIPPRLNSLIHEVHPKAA